MIRKKSKSEVNYGQGMPESHCGICEHFIEGSSACTKVRGVIFASKWCKLFKREERHHGEYKA